VLVEQDGVYSVIHTVSKTGAANYLDQPADAKAQGMPVWGYDFPPGRVAIQSLRSPWRRTGWPAWSDDKPVPFEETSAETRVATSSAAVATRLARRLAWTRQHRHPRPHRRRAGQWVREAKVATRLEDLGTLTVRYAANGPDLTTSREGVAVAAGLTLTYQSRNRAIIFAKPHTNRDRLLPALGDDGVTRLATVVGLWNSRKPRTWLLYAGDKRIESFPHRRRRVSGS